MEKIKNYIENWIRDYFENSKSKYLIIGLSGGLDSSTTLKLLTNAVEAKNIISLILPEIGITPKNDIKDAISLAKNLHVKYKIIKINKIVNEYVKTLPSLKKDKISLANVKPRIRMGILYAVANIKKGLVVGTSDKTEFYIGYFTKYGDGAADIYPILDLYKTQVRELAKYMQLPEKIINKPPSPNLWKGHLAEKELGISYEIIDKILYYKIESKEEMPNEKIAKILNINVDIVNKVENMIKNSEHKRNSLKYPLLWEKK